MQALFQPIYLYNLIVGVALPLIYINTIIQLMGKLVAKGFPPDLSRKVIHIAAGSWIWVWPLLDPSDGWSYIFNISVAVLWTLLFLQKGFTAKPGDVAVQTMTRTGDPKELLRGPLFFTLAMEFVGIFYYMTTAGVLTMAYLGWGDGLAPYIGKIYGKHKYKLLGREKSLEGSLTVFIAGFIGFIILYALVFWSLPSINLLTAALIMGVIATIVEAVSPADVDNLLIPAAILLACYLLGIK